MKVSQNVLGEQIVTNIHMKIKVLFSLLTAYVYEVWNFKGLHFLIQGKFFHMGTYKKTEVF
jgi:hypothetical protein